MRQLNNIIIENSYIKNCYDNKKRDPLSLSYLIDRTLSQSNCIKLGNGIEKIFQDIIMKYTKFTNIKPKNLKGKREKDHLFQNSKDKIIYYSELKSNINLDTEKSKSTCEKCIEIVEELKLQYPTYKIKWCLLSYRYKHNDEIPNNIRRKYTKIQNNLLGINQYLELVGINLKFTNQTYKLFLNNIANNMFN